MTCRNHPWPSCRPSSSPENRDVHARLPHPYLRRLRAADAGQPARLSGWVHRKRDHGGLLFIDLRDHYGLTQCVFAAGSPALRSGRRGCGRRASITVTGKVVPREPGTVNPSLPTGEIELRVAELAVQSAAEVLPIQVAGDDEYPEDMRLQLPLPRPAARASCTATSCCAPRSSPRSAGA